MRRTIDALGLPNVSRVGRIGWSKKKEKNAFPEAGFDTALKGSLVYQPPVATAHATINDTAAPSQAPMNPVRRRRGSGSDRVAAANGVNGA